MNGIVKELEELRALVESLQLHESPALATYTDYSATSTIVGWSSYTTKAIHYARVGRLTYVNFRIAGTSNSTFSRFTLPYTASGNYTLPVAALDNNGVVGSPIAYLDGTANAYLFLNINGNAWTASGTKDIRGQFFYMATS